MKAFKIVLFSLFFFTSYNSQASDQVKNIAVIATGGTIAGAGTQSTSSAYQAAQLPIDNLLNAVPTILASL
jgi:L-asparaginase/Glu-tRNA(Gln) amidotransferase subunit D